MRQLTADPKAQTRPPPTCSATKGRDYADVGPRFQSGQQRLQEARLDGDVVVEDANCLGSAVQRLADAGIVAAGVT